MSKLLNLFKKLKGKLTSINSPRLQNDNVSKKDFLIVVSHTNIKDSLVCRLLQASLDTLKIKYRFNYRIINLYSFNLPFLKINSKIPKDFTSLMQILNAYSNYVFVFPVWYSSVPAVLKNFIDWSGHWGSKKDSRGKVVGILKGKKVSIIASCWDTRKDYISKLSDSIQYQLVESVFSFYKIKHQETLIIQDAHNKKKKNLSVIENDLVALITSLVNNG